ncbi:MAG: MFS transporter [Rhabdochlamydiaceae bacterium]|nr:MFS transporter [Candidatus Amphrikana amoebophyrae]
MKKKFSLFALLPLILALMIDNMSFGAIFPLVTSIFQEYPQIFFGKATSIETIDWYMSMAYFIMPLGMFFGASFLGDLSDVLGRRVTMIAAMAGIGLGYLFMVLSIYTASIWLFLFGRLVTGLFAGSQGIGQAAIVDMSTPKTKAMAMSFLTFAICIGFTLGPIIVSIFTSITQMMRLRFELPLFVIGVGSLCSCFWLYQSFAESGKINKKHKVSILRPLHLLWEVGFHENLRIITPAMFFFQMGIALFFQTIMIKMQVEFHYDVMDLGLLMAFYGVVLMFTLTVLAKIFISRWKIEWFTMYNLIINGVVVILSAWVTSEFFMWVLIAFVSASNAFAYTGALTTFSNGVSSKRQGWAMGICVATAALGFVVGGLWMSLLQVLGTDWLITISGLSTLLGAFILYTYINRSEKLA